MISDISDKYLQQIQEEILFWYTKNKRDLPWRKTHDPYKILVSEIMLQQTQVSRVIPKYEAWLEKFPTVGSLAEAKKDEILRLWSGLGYNKRALYLQKCAIALLKYKTENVKLKIKNNDNTYFWPKTIEELEKMPGIGPYTARAVACFAFNQQVAVVDANVRKVILLKFANLISHPDQFVSKRRVEGSHTTNVKKSSSNTLGMTNRELQQIADQLLPIDRAYDWNQALMDYSNMVLQKEKVPTKKQSSFKDSNRFYRGKLMRLLLQKDTIPLQQVGVLLKEGYSTKDKAWLDILLDSMSIDGLITRDKEKITL